MKRPSTKKKPCQTNSERKEQTRLELLEAARIVFSQKGYHSTLISDIVAKAGFGQGTFYRHFRDKRTIFSELLSVFVDELVEGFGDMTAHLPKNQKEYHEASIKALTRLAGQLTANREFTLCVLNEAPAIDKEFAAQMSAIFERFGHLARFYLDHAVANGFARKCHSRVVAESLVGMGLRILLLWLNKGMTGLKIDALITEMVDLGFYGLARISQQRVELVRNAG